ncbi:MAG TPA: STAS domain-containing protein [Steroidobacteraceae bacterium]|nr:STAS domain-containing protein [Steroidobacteraceae bacterium]
MKKRKKTAIAGTARSGHAARRPANGRPPAATARSRAATGREGPFTLGGECTVSEAAELKSRLGRLIRVRRPVTLDIGGVERIDTAAMQIIAAFVRDRATQGLVVQWQGSSGALSSAARLLGLAPLLKLPA